MRSPYNHDRSYHNNDVPIVVVGMGFRGPGDACNINEFFKLLAEARETRVENHRDRWNHEAFYHPDATRKGSSNVRAGHYIKEDLSMFDAPFFKMTENEAASLDPQQRLLLETCYEALENAGTSLRDVAGSKTSVFVATFGSDYTDLLQRDPDSMPFYQATNSGYSRAIISNRLSYFFDLRGTSVTVDTACSGGLTAFHLACQSIQAGDAKQAIVGGSSVILHPDQFISLSAMRFLSPDGRCYTFDERANGYARGEGVGCLFLKRLDDAIANGDPIRAVVRMTGSNQDGKTPGISFPSRIAQTTLIKDVYARAGLDPAQTSYVEAHGTGTRAGDVIETSAIGESMREPGQSDSEPLWVGSVKANIGHLEAASGIASLVKCILMLENSVIFPNCNLQTVNPAIELEKWRLKIPRTRQVWNPCAGVHRLSINNFGYGGTNVHAILESAQDFLSTKSLALLNDNLHFQIPLFANRCILNGPNRFGNHDNSNNPYRVFSISAFDEASLKTQAKYLASYLKSRLADITDEFLGDLAYTLNFRRSIFPYRLAVSADSAGDLIRALEKVSRHPAAKIDPDGKPPTIGFVFTGQGAQWAGMGKELMHIYPVYADTLRRCRDHVKSLGATWDLIEEIGRDANCSSIARGKFSQPLCTALQIGLFELLATWGVHPTAVTGHSSGEIASAYAAGVISLEDAMTSAYYRGVCSDRVALAAKEGMAKMGSMMAASLSIDQAQKYLRSLASGYATVACHNSPSNITVSGDTETLEELKARLDQEGIFARMLIVEAAYHSQHMMPVRDNYLKSISSMKIATGSGVRFFSSVTGEQATPAQLGPQYWVDNMVGRVEFASSLRALAIETNVDMLVEIGPHAALSGPIRQILQADERLKGRSISYESVLKLKENAAKTCAALAAKFVAKGVSTDLTAVQKSEAGIVQTDLPPYAWNKSQRYWAESRISKEYRNCLRSRQDLLGRPELNFNPLDSRWRNFIRTTELPWVKDHRVQSNIVYPAAGYIAMAIEAAKQRASGEPLCYKLREVVIGQALIVPQDDDEEIETMITLKSYSAGTRKSSFFDLEWQEFAVYSVTMDNQWTEHCRGLIAVEEANQGNAPMTQPGLYSEAIDAVYLNELQNACTSKIDTDRFYETLRGIGLDYGPTFSNVTAARTGSSTQGSHARARDLCTAEITLPDISAIMPAGFEYPHVLHPAVLDATFHTILFAVLAGEDTSQDPMIPTFIESMDISSHHLANSRPGDSLNVLTSVKRKDVRQTRADITVSCTVESEPRLAISLHGVTLTRLSRDVVHTRVNPEYSAATSYNVRWIVDVDTLNVNALIRELRDEDSVTESYDLAISRLTSHYQYTKDLGYRMLERGVGGTDQSRILQGRDHLVALYNLAKALSEGAPRPSSKIMSIPATNPEELLLAHVGPKLTSIISGTQAWQTATRNEAVHLLDDMFNHSPVLIDRYKQIGRYLRVLSSKNPELNILEVGAGAGWPTTHILKRIGMIGETVPRFSTYHIASLHRKTSSKLQSRLEPWLRNGVAFKELNIEDMDGENEYLPPQSLDVIICCYLSLGVTSMDAALKTLQQFVKPGATIIVLEPRRDSPVSIALYATSPSWWNCIGDDVDKSWKLHDWRATLKNVGMGDGVEIPSVFAEADINTLVVSKVDAQIPSRMASPPFLLLVGNVHDVCFPIDALVERLRSWGLEVQTASIEDADPVDKVCIILWELIGLESLSSPTQKQFQAIQRIFLRSCGVLSIVQGATSRRPVSNMALGLSRTISSENGDTALLLLDIESEHGQAIGSTEVVEAIAVLINQHFLRSPVARSNTADTEFKLKDGRLMIPRLVPDEITNDMLKVAADGTSATSPQYVPLLQPPQPLRAAISTPGLLDTIHFVEDETMPMDLAASAVEIEVKAIGLNHRDLSICMGQATAEMLGGECSGVVTAVGSDVGAKFAVGDRVMCLHIGALRSFVRVDARLVQILPDDLSFVAGASLPVACCTALYATHHVARIQKSQTVLIHAAAGGLGQALVQFCYAAGAEVFVTVGSPEKKSLMTSRFGIADDHIFSSRDTASLSQGLLKATNGRGVDVVMNSLTGEGFRTSWNLIAPFGHFLELGSHNITSNTRLEMAQFAENVSFRAVNLWELMRARPAVVAEIWDECMQHFHKAKFAAPWPISTYGFAGLQKALKAMHAGHHMGKLVLVPRSEEVVKVLMPTHKHTDIFKADAAYLVAGGLGGIGRAIASWLVTNGARNIVFCGRSGDSRLGAKEMVQDLKNRGVAVFVYACDISDASQVRLMVEQMRAESIPSIRGIIQSAMVLRDDMFDRLTAADYNAVVRPKVQGTQNLHALIPGASTQHLDFFVMLSSISGIIGNATQAAYAAANTFMDAFASYRQLMGLHGVAIDLGAMEGVGYLADNAELLASMRRQGFETTTEVELIALLRQAVRPIRAGDTNACQIVTGLGRWKPGSSLGNLSAPMFSYLRRLGQNNDDHGSNDGSTKSSLRELLKKAGDITEAGAMTCAAIVAKVSTFSTASEESIDTSKPLQDYGVDSLNAVEIRNWVFRETDYTVPILELMAKQGIEKLAAKIAERSPLIKTASRLQGKGR